jgi:hypothetical protein
LNPVRDDEIGVARGDLVQVTDVNIGRGYRVRKQMSPQQQQQQQQPSEGWVPTYVLNLLTTGPRRPAWTFRKFRKPSFNNRKDSSGKLVITLFDQFFSTTLEFSHKLESLRMSSIIAADLSRDLVIKF